MHRTVFTLILMLSFCVHGSPDPERKAEHSRNKVVIKVKDKNGKWTTKKEIPLMFDNNRKATKKK